jgi:hypothetical protein
MSSIIKSSAGLSSLQYNSMTTSALRRVYPIADTILTALGTRLVRHWRLPAQLNKIVLVDFGGENADVLATPGEQCPHCAAVWILLPPWHTLSRTTHAHNQKINNDARDERTVVEELFETQLSFQQRITRNRLRALPRGF